MLRIAPQLTIDTIVMLGYHDDPALLYVITREKADDWEKYQILRRNVVHAFLFGKAGVGKVGWMEVNGDWELYLIHEWFFF